MRGNSTMHDFWQATYRSGSPVPYIITVQVLVFVLIHLFDLMAEVDMISTPLHQWIGGKLVLTDSLYKFKTQPWSLLTYSLLHKGLLEILFNCLWLYWMGTIFLNILHARQFLTIYISAVLIGGISYLTFSQIDGFTGVFQSKSLYGGAIGMGAILASLIAIVPKTEVRLAFLGTLQLRTVGIIYLVFQFLYYILNSNAAAAAYLISLGWGWLFMHLLKEGKDLSKIFQKRKKRTLKVVHTSPKYSVPRTNPYDIPDQEAIDAILDKISSDGYDSLTEHEKETLFRASKQEN